MKHLLAAAACAPLLVACASAGAQTGATTAEDHGQTRSLIVNGQRIVLSDDGNAATAIQEALSRDDDHLRLELRSGGTWTPEEREAFGQAMEELYEQLAVRFGDNFEFDFDFDMSDFDMSGFMSDFDMSDFDMSGFMADFDMSDFDMSGFDAPDVRIFIDRNGEGLDEDEVRILIEHHAEHAAEMAERHAAHAERHAERMAEHAARHAERMARHAERHAEHMATRIEMQARHAERMGERMAVQGMAAGVRGMEAGIRSIDRVLERGWYEEDGERVELTAERRAELEDTRAELVEDLAGLRENLEEMRARLGVQGDHREVRIERHNGSVRAWVNGEEVTGPDLDALLEGAPEAPEPPEAPSDR
jgi:vacuolar-type H+-ATPase subunit E/Vma4